jgi:glycosyltransferase involved in cell wall biosynthesis
MRILFVAMQESIHTARWINQIADQGWDIHLFPVSAYPVSPELHNATIYGLPLLPPRNISRSTRYVGLLPIGRSGNNLEKLIFRAYPELWFDFLAKLIQLIRPDIVHSLEFQHAGYMTFAARKKVEKNFPIWVTTNWGSDIYLYGRLAEHREKIQRILAACDYYSCECQRDVRLAKELGLTGKTLPVFPNSSGFDLSRVASLRQTGKVSSRRLILLKGYQHWAGRALTGLRALSLCKDLLPGYEVAIYSTNSDVEIAAELFEQETGIPVRIIPPILHDDMLRLFGQARIYLGLSISDAISTSLLEAMVMGSFPIQSCTSCADEWISDGQSGLIVPPEDPQIIAEAIRKALTDDDLVNQAAEINSRVAAERLDQEKIKPQVVKMYQEIYASRKE